MRQLRSWCWDYEPRLDDIGRGTFPNLGHKFGGLLLSAATKGGLKRCCDSRIARSLLIGRAPTRDFLSTLKRP